MEGIKQRLLNSGLLDGLKTEGEPTTFLKQLHSTALESMSKGELDTHLDYPKNGKGDSANSRNGTSIKRIKTKFEKVR
ncbi:transposase [Maribacter sp. 2304DJ31-5]|uniref:transposase n=1 Tax=Maribacter sp. 2304DJ31-5 TaxID=3386273 RepID=UPI0039BC76FD